MEKEIKIRAWFGEDGNVHSLVAKSNSLSLHQKGLLALELERVLNILKEEYHSQGVSQEFNQNGK